MIWTPHATVATVVENEGKLLMVEEMCHGQRVFNQPAGHVDEEESIFDAAIRETLEETGWQVKLDKFIGTYIYTAPQNGVTYYRFCFSAQPVAQTSNELDQDIVAAHWMNIDDIYALGRQLRSPLVTRCIDDYLNRPMLPLDYIYEHSSTD